MTQSLHTILILVKQFAYSEKITLDCLLFVLDNVSDPTPPPGSWYENTTLPANTLEEAQEKTRVRFAFWIMAAVNVCTVDKS